MQLPPIKQMYPMTWQTLVGIIDSDGTFGVVIDTCTGYLEIYSIRIEINQKDKTLLTGIVDFLALHTQISIPYEKLLYQKPEGTWSLRLNRSIPYYDTIMYYYYTQMPPYAPSKYLDYRMTEVFTYAQDTNASQAITHFVQKWNLNVAGMLRNSLIDELVLVQLRYKMYYTSLVAQGEATVQNSVVDHPEFNDMDPTEKKTMVTPLKTHLDNIGAPQLEVIASEKLAHTLTQHIYGELNKLKTALPKTILPLDYLIGLHIGDGSFYYYLDPGQKKIKVDPTTLVGLAEKDLYTALENRTVFSEQDVEEIKTAYNCIPSKVEEYHLTMSVQFHWKFTDCIYNKLLGEAIMYTLNTQYNIKKAKIALEKSKKSDKEPTSYKINVQTLPEIKLFLKLFENKDLVSKKRNHQYHVFSYMYNFYETNKSNNMKIFIDMTLLLTVFLGYWHTNEDTNARKKYAQGEVLAKMLIVYIYKNRLLQ